MTLSRLFNRTFQRALALGLALTLGPGPGLVLAASPDADAAKAVATHGIPKGSNRDSTHSATQGTKHSSNKNRSTSRSVLEGAILKQQRSKFTDVHSIGGLGINGYPPLLIGPGDVLDIAVYGEDELPLEYQVDSDGTITYPYTGAVRLSGLTPAQASVKMAGLLGKPRKVTVLIKESNTYWVSVMGHVGRPGKYQIRGKPTLLSALAEAGGPLPGAKLGSAILIHQGFKTKVNLKQYLTGSGQSAPESFLFPGDVLMVPKSGLPSVGDMAIVASILASVAVVTVDLNALKKKN